MQQQRSYAAVCIHRRTWQHFFKWTFVSCLFSFISSYAYYFCHQQSIQIKSIVSRRLITLLCRPIDATFLLVNYGWSTTSSSRLCCSFHTSVPQAGHPKCRISIYSLFTLMPLIIVGLLEFVYRVAMLTVTSIWITIQFRTGFEFILISLSNSGWRRWRFADSSSSYF